ncbi:hypothetical protein ElyMa_000887600 [Elysia marginata]|uniref:CARD domain-containing protein n=1 Tax=Elysia marginata TaxID=1093978 RepID=A0AAV4H6A4_9GAST|nr:hypothetical protein ElyMa_000887600 [Elysia marginata]
MVGRAVVAAAAVAIVVVVVVVVVVVGGGGGGEGGEGGKAAAAAAVVVVASAVMDLVDGLDADAIIDYLCHHGVLDTTALPDIDSKASQPERNQALLQQVEGRGTTAVALFVNALRQNSKASQPERNQALLQQVEGRGTTAVALFVNALRQSGQLHLASSLDTEQRIRPSTSGGYFGKGRHKGEVTVRIEVEFLKILAPRELRPDKVVDASLLNDQLDGVVVKDDDEDDQVKPRCWCFCLSSRRSKTKGRKKKSQSMSPPPDNSMERDAGEERQGKSKKQPKKSKEKNKAKKSSSSSKQDTQYQSAKYSLVEPTRDQLDGSLRPFDSSGDNASLAHDQEKHRGLNSSSVSANTVNGKHSNNQSASHKDKSRHDPIIMEFDPKLELVKLRAGQDELASPTRQQTSPQHFPGGPETSVGMLVEQWKSSGPHFQRKATQLCTSLVQSARDDLVKYFEQDRGTLVLDVVQDGASVLVINICMQASQVKCLKKDVAEAEDEDKTGTAGGQNGLGPSKKKEKSALDEEEEEEVGLLDKLQSILFSTVDIRDFDIRGIKLHLALDNQEVNAALSELS